MRNLAQILNTEATREGWKALIEDNAWFCDCPYDDESDEYGEWVHGRHLAMTVQGAANWALWLNHSTGRSPAPSEIALLFAIAADDVHALLEAVSPFIGGPISDADLQNAVQAWAFGKAEPASVGQAAAALEIPLEQIAALVPQLGDQDAGFFFREHTDRPLADQVFGFDGE